MQPVANPLTLDNSTSLMHLKILAVVVTYNGNHWIEDCLGSLQQSSIPLDVIVIDNHSTDSTTATIKKYFPKVQLVESVQNLGFGRANNVGLKKALDEDYDYVFLLNQDAWIEPDTVKVLIEANKQYPQYGIISPMHLNQKKTSLDSKFANYLCQANNGALMSDLLLPHLPLQNIYTVGFVNAAAWLISKQCLQKVGGFDPLFFHYGEDEDYIQRVFYYGFKVGFSPHTTIVHDREGYVKQSDMRRSLPTQYKDCLIILKNVHRQFNTNLYVAIRNELYYAIVALFKLDISQLIIKIRLLYKIFSRSSAARRSWKYCMTHEKAYIS